MVLGVSDRVVRRAWGEEVCGNKLRALVEKLIERMLSVRTRCTPYDGLRK